MSTDNRVFITGLGALTATGESVEATWDAIVSGRHGLDAIKHWDLSTWDCQLGGELKDFQPAKLLPDRKLMKVISRQDVMGINAAVQAVTHSGLLSYRDTLPQADTFNDETAVFVGSPGNKYYQQYDFLPLVEKSNGQMPAFAADLFNEVHPMWLLRILPNNVLAYTGITYGFKGVNHNVTNHAVGGMQAVIEAYHAIRTGQAQRAVVVAYDVGTEPQALFYYERLGVLSAKHLQPFDVSHDGTVLAEGAAALVLESEASVNARSAACYGEIIGGGSATEAAGLFTIEAEGGALAKLISRTLENSQLEAKHVGMVVAHANGNKKSDISESHALADVFATHEVPVTGFKWSMGHTLCASGVLDVVLSTQALCQRLIPGVANFKTLAPACKPLNVRATSQSLDSSKPYAVIINRGFASMNACLVIKSV